VREYLKQRNVSKELKDQKKMGEPGFIMGKTLNPEFFTRYEGTVNQKGEMEGFGTIFFFKNRDDRDSENWLQEQRMEKSFCGFFKNNLPYKFGRFQTHSNDGILSYIVQA
jgi:hypothetical protein